MAATGHTYGRSCLLSSEIDEPLHTASDGSGGPPPIKAHFFYCSPLPIDDPLAPIPPPTSNATSRPLRLPPRPFSLFDSLALDDAWLKFHKLDSSKRQLFTEAEDPLIQTNRTPSRSLDHDLKRRKESSLGDASREESLLESLPKASMAERGRSRNRSSADTSDVTLHNNYERTSFDNVVPVTAEEIRNNEFESGLKRKDFGKWRSESPFHHRNRPEESVHSESIACRRTSKPPEIQAGTSPSERDTTGTPFLRASTRLKGSRSRSSERHSNGPLGPPRSSSVLGRAVTEAEKSRSRTRREDHFHGFRHNNPQITDVMVGAQQLHVVELPGLKMGPVYWDPVHDVASVIRGTWFYKETMWPVEADIANQIEEGYAYMKPWTASYIDELNSCERIGPDAELKLVHNIWPMDEPPRDQKRPLTGDSRKRMSYTNQGSLGLDQQDRQEAKRSAACAKNRAAGSLDGFDSPGRLFAKSSMIYANARDAQILAPNQLPSVARGRRPLAKIRKGRGVGIPVIRGFDKRLWEKLHPPSKQAATLMRSQESHESSKLSNGLGAEEMEECGACRQVKERKIPTDLILVIHGIGQKLSERVESFHFTHAINAFRRQVNLELDSEAVRPWLRQGLGSITVLPVNWRSRTNLDNLENGGPESDSNPKDNESRQNPYKLKDITADSLPAIRSLISDVMLDIPFYLSNHKQTMIGAAVDEANHIYRLWCQKNPGFQESGRVHLLAHSLGSLMALDILSRQPTRLPKPLDLTSKNVGSNYFHFDTNNLFLCGSPVGLFLLLNHATLLPRKGREKPDAEMGDSKITGSVGTYGCLAVDNVYNISHQFDPIAYKVNACVDAGYAASLRKAYVPSASASWSQLFSAVFRGKAAAHSKTTNVVSDHSDRPKATKMPSTVEMEIHNFTREEIAEKKMYLLNDNGQIDYILRTGGGPLEIQYLNMLSAHNAYWIMDDFVRFIVVEIGRKPGRSHSLGNMKAVKKAWVDQHAVV